MLENRRFCEPNTCTWTEDMVLQMKALPSTRDQEQAFATALQNRINIQSNSAQQRTTTAVLLLSAKGVPRHDVTVCCWHRACRVHPYSMYVPGGNSSIVNIDSVF